jgi:hypothetical protein
MSGRVPNMHQGRIYGYAPFGNRQRAELYIDYVQAHGANNFGIIFFVAKDLHNEGRRIVGVYGNANIHGICNEQWSRHGRYPLRPPDPPKFPPFDAYLGSLIFDDFPPPADVANILINLPLQHWFTPHLSGEIEISTHFPPLDALTYIPGLDRYCRSTPCFPLILDDKSKDKVWKGYEIPDAYSLSKKILDDAKATTTDPVVIRKIDALIKKVEQSRHSA